MTGGRGPMIVTEEKSKMTVDLMKILVCPRLRDDHSGRLVENPNTYADPNV